MDSGHRENVAWVKDDPLGIEFADVLVGSDQVSAVGVCIGTRPVPYRLDYSLETMNGFVTTRLVAAAHGQGWRRTLELERRRVASGALAPRQTVIASCLPREGSFQV